MVRGSYFCLHMVHVDGNNRVSRTNLAAVYVIRGTLEQ